MKLPFAQLAGQENWIKFEKLIADIFTEEFKHEGQTFSRYEEGGTNQEGIDVYAYIPNLQAYIVAQCKAKTDMAPGKLKDILEAFKKGKFARAKNTFYLCTLLQKHKSGLVKEWEQQAVSLRSQGINIFLWDQNTLAEKLRRMPYIVEKFWNADVAEKYCSQVMFRQNYPNRYESRKTYLNENNKYVCLENEVVFLEMFLPAMPEQHPSALLKFSRSDLGDATIALAAKDLIDLLQEISHTQSIAKTRACVEHHKDQYKYSYVIGNIKITLLTKDIECVDWVLSTAWKHYLNASLKLIAMWKTKRFQRYVASNSYEFKLVHIKPWFWQAIKEYAEKFSYTNGSSDNHIFMPSETSIIICTPDQRANMESGFHAEIKAHPELRHWTSVHIILTWTANSGYCLNTNSHFSSRELWEAEHTHSWLISSFLPAVYTWIKEKELQDKKRTFLAWLGLSSSSHKNYPEMQDCFNSQAGPVYPVRTQPEALELTRKLQNHFYIATTGGIKRYLIMAIIRLCNDLLGPNSQCDEIYIKNKLQLPNTDTVYTGLKELLADEENKVFPNASMLEISLRVLEAIIEDLENVDELMLKNISDQIKPVYDRYIEDVVCSSYF